MAVVTAEMMQKLIDDFGKPTTAGLADSPEVREVRELLTKWVSKSKAKRRTRTGGNSSFPSARSTRRTIAAKPSSSATAAGPSASNASIKVAQTRSGLMCARSLKWMHVHCM
jgi:hypothetical protein